MTNTKLIKQKLRLSISHNLGEESTETMVNLYGNSYAFLNIYCFLAGNLFSKQIEAKVLNNKLKRATFKLTYVPSVATELPPFGILSKSQSILEAIPLALSSMTTKFNSEIYKSETKTFKLANSRPGGSAHYNMATKAHA